MTWIKICGITSVADAVMAVASGADALGLNFVPASKRVIDAVTAAHIADAVGDSVELVAVVADRTLADLEELLEITGIGWLQLHGEEAPQALLALLPRAFKAVALSTEADAMQARTFPGQRLLVDAKVPGQLGGTGQRFDWSLAIPLARERDLIVAGGLSSENVAEAVGTVAPWGVDVASGVEVHGNPRQKDEARMRAFVAAVHGAARP